MNKDTHTLEYDNAPMFKAWHKVQKKMLYHFDGIFNTGHYPSDNKPKPGLMVCIGGYHWTRANWGKPDDIELLAYIGVRDINNKPIFNYDIVKIIKDDQYAIVVYDRQKAAYELKYQKTIRTRLTSIYRQIRATFSDGIIYQDETIEVCGSFFENPDLVDKIITNKHV